MSWIFRTVHGLSFLAVAFTAYPQEPANPTGTTRRPIVQNPVGFINPNDYGQNDTAMVNGIRYIKVGYGMRWVPPDTTGKTVYIHTFMAMPRFPARVDSAAMEPNKR